MVRLDVHKAARRWRQRLIGEAITFGGSVIGVMRVYDCFFTP